MSAATPTQPPASFTAGDTLQFELTLPNYPAGEGWEGSFVMNLRKGGHRIAVTMAASGNAHLVNESAETTASFQPGDYNAQVFVAKAGQRFTAWTGAIRILPNIAASENGEDTRSFNRRMLAKIETALEAAITAQEAGKAITEWETEGLKVKKSTPEQLLKELDALHATYLGRVRAEDDAERLASGKGSRRRIVTRFVTTR